MRTVDSCAFVVSFTNHENRFWSLLRGRESISFVEKTHPSYSRIYHGVDTNPFETMKFMISTGMHGTQISATTGPYVSQNPFVMCEKAP